MIAARRKLTVVTIVYWVLLLYMISALIWWFVALQNQNYYMAQMRLLELKKDDPAYLYKVETIESSKKRKAAQYDGEGITFLALIVMGAIFVFRPVRRQIRLSQQQNDFMMAVTHELKTPIAVTKLNLETLQKRKLDEAMQQKLISNTLQEANRLNILCNNILLASQLDAGLYTSSKQEINYSELVEGCVEDFIIRYPQRKIVPVIEEGLYIQGEELLLQMVVNNLVENALKYSPKEAGIEIALQEADKQLQLQVKDEGNGVPVEEKKKIFERFYRSGSESTRKTKGTGLGLYLCYKIVKGHNGYISVTDNTPRGSIFTVTFNT